MNTYDVDDEYNAYSVMLVPYMDGESLNVKVGMSFPKVEDDNDQIHLGMLSTLGLLVTAFKLLQHDEKLNKKLYKHYKETLKDFSGRDKEEPKPTVVEYLDKDKTIIKPTFNNKDK